MNLPLAFRTSAFFYAHTPPAPAGKAQQQRPRVSSSADEQSSQSNAEDYRRSRYDLHRYIREAKRQYRLKLEGYYTTMDSQRKWQGLQHITN
ncbi:hypothetical protein AOLI_G00053270 [Acnodon oligacanthus]